MSQREKTLPTPLGQIVVRTHRANDGTGILESMVECYSLKDWFWPNFREIFLRVNALNACLSLLGGGVLAATRSPLLAFAVAGVPASVIFVGLVYRLHRWPEKMPDMKDVADFYSRPGRGFWVAALRREDTGVLENDEDGGDEIVGGVGLMEKNEAGTGELVRLFVLAPYRKYGVGGALFGSLLEAAREIGYQRLVLHSSVAQKDAYAFYRRQGFRVVNTWKAAGLLEVNDFQLDIDR